MQPVVGGKGKKGFWEERNPHVRYAFLPGKDTYNAKGAVYPMHKKGPPLYPPFQPAFASGKPMYDGGWDDHKGGFQAWGEFGKGKDHSFNSDANQSNGKARIEDVERFAAVGSVQRNGKEKKKSHKRICFACGKVGHYARDCKENSMLLCHSCGKLGHFARLCPLLQHPTHADLLVCVNSVDGICSEVGGDSLEASSSKADIVGDMGEIMGEVRDVFEELKALNASFGQEVDPATTGPSTTADSKGSSTPESQGPLEVVDGKELGPQFAEQLQITLSNLKGSVVGMVGGKFKNNEAARTDVILKTLERVSVCLEKSRVLRQHSEVALEHCGLKSLTSGAFSALINKEQLEALDKRRSSSMSGAFKGPKSVVNCFARRFVLYLPDKYLFVPASVLNGKMHLKGNPDRNADDLKYTSYELAERRRVIENRINHEHEVAGVDMCLINMESVARMVSQALCLHNNNRRNVAFDIWAREGIYRVAMNKRGDKKLLPSESVITQYIMENNLQILNFSQTGSNGPAIYLQSLVHGSQTIVSYLEEHNIPVPPLHEEIPPLAVKGSDERLPIEKKTGCLNIAYLDWNGDVSLEESVGSIAQEIRDADPGGESNKLRVCTELEIPIFLGDNKGLKHEHLKNMVRECEDNDLFTGNVMLFAFSLVRGSYLLQNSAVAVINYILDKVHCCPRKMWRDFNPGEREGDQPKSSNTIVE